MKYSIVGLLVCPKKLLICVVELAKHEARSNILVEWVVGASLPLLTHPLGNKATAEPSWFQEKPGQENSVLRPVNSVPRSSPQ